MSRNCFRGWERESARLPEADPLEVASQVGMIETAAHRKQHQYQVTPKEQERTQLADRLANTFRAILAIGQATLLDLQNDVDGRRPLTSWESNAIPISGEALSTAGFSSALAQIERQRGNYAEAQARVDAVIEEDRRTRNLPGLAGALGFSALVKLDLGQVAEARKTAEEGLAAADASGSGWQKSRCAAGAWRGGNRCGCFRMAGR